MITRFNNWVALHLVQIIGTMWCAYAFFAYSIVPAYFPKLQEQFLYWGNAVQLTMGPIILVGQAI